MKRTTRATLLILLSSICCCWLASAFVTRNRPSRSPSVRATSSSALFVSSTAPPPVEETASSSELPEKGPDGIYHLVTKEQHAAFLQAHSDKLIVLKFFAPWCRACKGLEPKFIQISKDEKWADVPMVFADFTVQHNKDFVKSLGILALPSVQLYAGSLLQDSFPCGPSKTGILRKKLGELVANHIDASTKLLKQPETTVVEEEGEEAEPCASRSISTGETSEQTEISVGECVVSQDMMKYMREDIPFFRDFSDDEFYGLLQKAKLLTFDPGSVVLRQGKPGRLFYVIESGEVEILVKGAYLDPLSTPASYMGTAINRMGPQSYFGERALITGEPRAVTMRATDKLRCFAFDIEDIPSSTILSGKKQVTDEWIQKVNEKYDLDFYDINMIEDQFKSANLGNQVRGSVNRPEAIKGVDTPDEPLISMSGDSILPLLVQFRMVRYAARCFNYIMDTNPAFGDAGEIRRRSLLVSKLSPSQQEDFKGLFQLIDTDNSGTIELMEIKRVMESVGEVKTDEELLDLINKGDVSVDGNTSLNFADFMGIMAESEIYHLFTETFKVLDPKDTGFVMASELDRVLCGMRDLISNDKTTIIDVEDSDMQIDYEQFSKMLLGTLG